MSQGNDAAHEVAAIMKYIAKSAEPQVYLGLHPKDNYLHKAHLMPDTESPRLLNEDLGKKLEYKSIGSDLLNLRVNDSLYQREILGNGGYIPQKEGIDYSSCQGLYCQN